MQITQFIALDLMCRCLTPQGKRSLLIRACIAQLPHPCEATDPLIPQISPPGKKYLLLLRYVHMEQVQAAHGSSLTIPKKQNETSFGPEAI